MRDQTLSAIKLLEALTERAKELTCLYAIEELLKKPYTDLEHVCDGIIRAIPPGWQYPEICQARITLEDRVFESEGFEETEWMLCADIVMHEAKAGTLAVYYTHEMPAVDIGPFLKEEKKLIQTIADRLGHFMVYKQMERVVNDWQSASGDPSDNSRSDWEAVLDLLRQTDNTLFMSISNKMLNHLCWSGIKEANDLRLSNKPLMRNGAGLGADDVNRAHSMRALDFSTEIIERIFCIAGDHLSDDEILSRIQMWIQEDRLSHLVQIVQRHLPLSQVMDAMRRYFCTAPFEADAKYPVSRGLKVSLIRRILSDDVGYINRLKEQVELEDLHHLLQNVIFSPESHGKLGRRSSAFFLASQIVENAKSDVDPLDFLQIPKTWYISSDMMLHFMHYNHIDEIIEQKYKEIERIRLEYPHIVQTFTQSAFPPDMVRALSAALDDLGEVPLIVRSSSLLEERSGSTFTGEYRSVFVINRGSKQERLAELMTAVARVYASAFSADPIEFRAGQSVLDFSEEMGIMIQQAVGTRVGPYFLPAYTGVALSRNDFRWAHDLERDDGLVSLVPGMGDRCGKKEPQTHPVLFSPGQPGLKVYANAGDAIKFAPRTLDVINLDERSVETMDVKDFLDRTGKQFPQMESVFSLNSGGLLLPPEEQVVHDGNDNDTEWTVTFDGLIERSPFVVPLRKTLKRLEEKMGGPVSLRFASDGEKVFLLECSLQQCSKRELPAPIPRDIEERNRLFSVKRALSDGRISNITHVIYIDPDLFQSDNSETLCNEVEQAVRSLNTILPKRQFMVIHPHPRRGEDAADENGAPIPFSMIDRAAFFAELHPSADASDAAFRVPCYHDLFSTGIRYIPLCSGDEDMQLNRLFLERERNLLKETLPECAHLSKHLRLLDLTRVGDGKVLEILMNTDLEETVAVLGDNGLPELQEGTPVPVKEMHPESYWRWRYGMAEQIASSLDPERFGIKGFYLFGSTKNGTAGPGSDIDVLIHFRGSDEQWTQLEAWLEGWSLCLDEMNYLKTGYRSKGLLDVHVVTDEDIAAKSSFAVKINAITDAARPLKMKGQN